MILIDLLRVLSNDVKITITDIDTDFKTHGNVGKLQWQQIKHYENKNIYWIIPFENEIHIMIKSKVNVTDIFVGGKEKGGAEK